MRSFKGYPRPDGGVGIRNRILIICVDECCEGIGRHIARGDEDAVVLTNWYTCMLGGNEESFNQMIANGTSPNVAAVMVVAMGCGSIALEQIADPIAASGRPVETLHCQNAGGTRRAIAEGREKLEKLKAYADGIEKQDFPLSRLVVGIKCGGSDTSSGIASNPSVGEAADRLVDMGGICIGGELFELQGCERELDARAASPEIAAKIRRLITDERDRWSVEGTDVETMSIGNSVGGLTTIEEKSLGALHKFGSRPIVDILQINKDFIDRPEKPGFYLSEATMLCGGAGVNFASLGAHIILWTSGAAGFNNPLVPVIRVSGNKELYNEDMDVDARGIMDGTDSLDAVAGRIVDKVAAVAGGEPTSLEGLGESTLTLYQKDQRLDKLLGIPCGRS